MSVHVIVETNWVVAFAAPVLARSTHASELLAAARAAELALHIPAVALVEARKVIQTRNVGRDVDMLRSFVRDAHLQQRLSDVEAAAARKMLDQFEQAARKERELAPVAIERLRQERGVSVFPLDDEMLTRSVDLSTTAGIDLQSFDLAIFAATLVLGTRLSAEGHEVSMCTLDADLQPWDRLGALRHPFTELYDAASVWVHSDLLRLTPPRPPNWPGDAGSGG